VIIFVLPALLVVGARGEGVVVVEVEGTGERGKGVQEALWQGERRMHVVTVKICLETSKRLVCNQVLEKCGLLDSPAKQTP
jgi:hypothetical protein